MYTYTYIHIYIHIYICTHIYIYIYVYWGSCWWVRLECEPDCFGPSMSVFGPLIFGNSHVVLKLWDRGVRFQQQPVVESEVDPALCGPLIRNPYQAITTPLQATCKTGARTAGPLQEGSRPYGVEGSCSCLTAPNRSGGAVVHDGPHEHLKLPGPYLVQLSLSLVCLVWSGVVARIPIWLC